MKKYVVVVDTSGDFDKEFIEKYNIKFIPMQYSLGEEMRTSYGIEEPEILKKFYDGQRGGDLTRTSQITPFMYEEFFEPYLKDGISVLYLALSSGLSSTYNAACLAQESLKEKYPDVDMYPIDTLGATGGIGVLLERAISNQEKGLTLEENRDDLLKAVPHINHWFLVQDLNYLKRGGRVSATTAFVGTMLNIKPILQVDKQGKLTTVNKMHGNKKAVKCLFDYFKENYLPEWGNIVYISDGDAKELSDELAALVKAEYPDVIIKQPTLCPIIGAHTGPGLIAICFLGK